MNTGGTKNAANYQKLLLAHTEALHGISLHLNLAPTNEAKVMCPESLRLDADFPAQGRAALPASGQATQNLQSTPQEKTSSLTWVGWPASMP